MVLCFDKHRCQTFLGWWWWWEGHCACHELMNQAMLPQAQFSGSGPAVSAHYCIRSLTFAAVPRWRPAHSQSRGLLATLLPDLDRPRVGEGKGQQGL